MWRGRSEGDQGGSPPDPLEEQSDTGHENVEFVKQELGDLKEQFDQQQALIGQLKDMIKKKESAVDSQGNEVEGYAARLAKMKPRLVRVGATKKLVLQERVVPLGSSEDTVTGNEPTEVGGGARIHGAVEERLVEEKKLPSSESGSRAKILLLRKQLDENRLKFERQQKENMEKRASMEDMKSRIERLRIEVEERDILIQSLQEGRGVVSEESITQKLYQQIIYKDNTVLELTQKINQLEEIIQEQRETLSEKDSVIEARTEAVSLVAKAQDEKSIKTVEELDEVRYQMKKMQEDFIAKEQEFLSEKESLTKELKEKAKKVTQLEDNGRRLENLRFELSTRNAELQEKIVTLQADTKTLRNQSELDRKAAEERDSLLQELKQKLVKAEAHGQKKLKALEKQFRSIKGDGNAGEQILLLQNSIAELEEEKGNLQLKLVDFDDLKIANEKLTLSRNKMEDKIKHLNNDLDSQLSAITLLETEKIKLVEGTNERENRIFDLESELTSIKTSLAEISQAKVTVELRLCEVEEQRDVAEKARVELENQVFEAKQVPVEQLMAEKGSLEESLQSIMKEKDELETKYLDQITAVQECEEKTEAAVQEKETKVRECKRLMNILTDKENTITTLSIKIDKHDAVVADVKNQLTVATETLERKKMELEEMSQKFQQEVQKVSEVLKTKEDMEVMLSNLSSKLHSQEAEVAAVKETVESLSRTINEKNITIQNLVGEVSHLQDQIKFKDKSINDHINMLEQMESQINARDHKIEEFHTSLLKKDEQLLSTNEAMDKLEKEVKNVTQQLETTKESYETELNVLLDMLNGSKNQVESLSMEIQVKVQEIQNNQIIISKYEHEICDKNKALEELQVNIKSLEDKVSCLDTSLSEKETFLSHLRVEMEETSSYIDNLVAQKSALEQKLHQLQNENLTLTKTKSNLEVEMSEVRSLLQQKDESIFHFNSEATSKSNQQIRDIEILKQVLVEKEEQICVLEATVGGLTSEVEHKASETEKWQAEALEKCQRLTEITLELENVQLQVEKADSVISDLKSQLTQNQELLEFTQGQVSHTQHQFIESREQFTQKEIELEQTREQLSEREILLALTQEQLDKTKEDLSITQSRLEETHSHCEEATTLVAQLKEQLQLKETNLETVEKQVLSQQESNTMEMEIVRTELQTLKSEVARLEIDLQASREYAENLEIGSSKIQEWATQLQGELENAKLSHNSAHNDLIKAKDELVVRGNELEQLQLALVEERRRVETLQTELVQAVSSKEQQQQRADSLQTELTQALSLQQQSDSEVAALSLVQQQTITRLESELLSVTQARDQLHTENNKNLFEFQDQTKTIALLNTNIEELNSQIKLKDEDIHSLERSVVEHKNTVTEVQNSLREMIEAKKEVTELPSGPEGDSLISLKEELAAAQDQIQFLEEECDGLRADANTLKQQLQEARQTITQLQTTLATQSQSTTTASSVWEDWGEVDLGTPETKELPNLENSLVNSLQKSLTDKDEMLMMIQDQLKDALQQINTITEEKKVLEQKKRSAEANSAQQKQQWEEDHEELLAIKKNLEDMESLQSTLDQERQRLYTLDKELCKKQQDIELSQQIVPTTHQQHEQLQHSDTSAYWLNQEYTLGAWPSCEQTFEAWPVADKEAIATTQEGSLTQATQSQVTGLDGTSTSHIQWNQPGDDPFTFLHKTEENSEQNPATWFDEYPQQEPEMLAKSVQPVGESVAKKEMEEPPQQQQQPEESVNVEDLKYRLLWYEEQWTNWTSNYTQYQVSYQEAEQQIAQLTQQIQELQGRQVKADETTPSNIGFILNESKVEQQEQEIMELQSKLCGVETAHEQLKEENHNLRHQMDRISELEERLEKLTGSAPRTDRLEDAEAEVDRLRGFETQVYELQSQVQALQHQCTAMQKKLAEAEIERSRLREVEILYGELQSCIQESETKREGSKSRVLELELMVQSAESEISRLRNEIEELNQAGQAVETDRERLQTDAHGLGTEMTKLRGDVLRLQKEVELYQNECARLQNEIELCRNKNVKLQDEGGAYKAEALRLHNESESFKEESVKRQTGIDGYKAEISRLEGENRDLDDEVTRIRSELQRIERENNQLRSELEVMEGEHERLRGDYEVLEAENNRSRGEYEVLSQANQMTEAEKESLESEVQRITAQNMTITSENDHFRGEIQRLTEVGTSADSEITRLRAEIERFKLLDSQYNDLELKYNELQTQVATIELHPRSKNPSESDPHCLVEEVDWSSEGRKENEHLLRSSSVDLKYQEEIDCLKAKVIALEKEKNGLYDELQASKMKSGKMLQKFKLTQSKNEALSKEVQKLKAKAGGFSDLDQALEEEWKAQIARAETERDELKQRLDEVENEKEHFVNQVDVLTAAQEHYLELKEDQDTTIMLLKARNKELEGQVQALEWKISELEEVVDQQQMQEKQFQSLPVQAAPDTSQQALSSDDVKTLRVHVSSLHQEIKSLKTENGRLQALTEELEEKVECLSNDNVSFQSLINKLKEAKSKAESDVNNYKSSYIELDAEHVSVKKEKERVNEELKELSYTHSTLKAAYNSMFAEYNDLRDVCYSHKHDIGILKGERDRLVEEVDSLKKQLQALHEEEEEETIRALQDECFSLREQNNLLHEENTALEVQAENAKDKAARISNALEQNVEMQQLLRDELMKKSEELSFHTTTIDGQDRKLAYMNAEMAAMKTKLAQQDQAQESSIETTFKLEQQLEELQEYNQHLHHELEVAEESLTKLTGANEDVGSDEAVFTPSPPAGTELEAALASLHLRDLRCQQLSIEITKLLEERDALQLKLSASLRQTQELTRELSLSHQLPASVSPEPSLDQKLAELRELNDSLEQKALSSFQSAVSTSMGRRITIGGLPPPPMFTPHTAPPTPTATRHADYTLTREAQGTSTTLMDWIMGKSTPRVLHV